MFVSKKKYEDQKAVLAHYDTLLNQGRTREQVLNSENGRLREMLENANEDLARERRASNWLLAINMLLLVSIALTWGIRLIQ